MKKIKKSINNIFLNHLKTLDLHGETTDIARLLTIDFIKQYINTEKKVVIIHGIGSGLVKQEVYNILKRNKHILKYYLENDGCTVVIFNNDKNQKLLI